MSKGDWVQGLYQVSRLYLWKQLRKGQFFVYEPEHDPAVTLKTTVNRTWPYLTNIMWNSKAQCLSGKTIKWNKNFNVLIRTWPYCDLIIKKGQPCISPVCQVSRAKEVKWSCSKTQNVQENDNLAPFFFKPKHEPAVTLKFDVGQPDFHRTWRSSNPWTVWSFQALASEKSKTTKSQC